MRSREIVGTRTMLLAVLAVAAAAAISFRPVYEPDLWWHLAQGRENAAGHLVRTNLFNLRYAAYPQAYTPWLFDLGAYVAWRIAGGAGIQAAQAACLTLTLALTFVACRQRGASTAAILAVFALGLAVVEPRALPRPHLASFAGMAACVLLIERARRRGSARPLAAALPLVACWSNLHVEVFLGLLPLGVFAVTEWLRPASLSRGEAARALAIAAACGVATLANPYGWGIAHYLAENWRVPQILNIAELRPAYLPTYRPFFVYLAAASAAWLWRLRGRRPDAADLGDLATAAIFGALGARFLRFTPLVFIVSAPAVAAALTAACARGLDGRALLATALAATIATARQPLVVFTRLGIGTRAVAPVEFFPPGFGRVLRETGLHGPVFTSLNLGGFVAWEMYPEAQIYQDSRLQAVPPEHFLATLRASRDPAAWERLLEGIDWAVISLPRPNELSGAGHFPETLWRPVFEDRAVRVVVRRGSPFDRVGGR